MPDNIIKFGKAKKSLAKKQREAQAAQNRIKHGLTKADKQKLKAEQEKAAQKIDGHKRSDDETG